MTMYSKELMADRLKDLRTGKKPKYSLKQLSNAVHEKTGVIIGASALGYYEDVKDTRSPSSEFIAALATFHGVSVDFLLGRTDDDKGDANIKAVEERLGLSSDAQKVLKNEHVLHGQDNNQIQFLNKLIVSNQFKAICSALNDCYVNSEYALAERGAYPKGSPVPSYNLLDEMDYELWTKRDNPINDLLSDCDGGEDEDDMKRQIKEARKGAKRREYHRYRNIVKVSRYEAMEHFLEFASKYDKEKEATENGKHTRN